MTDLAAEIRDARLGLGLRQADIARAVGISQPQVSRAERADYSTLSFPTAARLAAVVGLDLSVRCFPTAAGGLRDVAHQRLIQRLRERVSAAYGWRLEAPVDGADGQRSFDVMLHGRGFRVAVEAETRLHDLQALIRRVALKREAAGVERLVLVVAATRSNRHRVTEARSYLSAAFPLDTRRTMRFLAAGDLPPADGIALI